MGVFKAWDQQPQPDASNVVPITRHTNGTSPYGRAALERELHTLASATEGTRNQTLNDVTFNIAQLVNAGHLPNSVFDEITAAARGIGLTATEVTKTMASARSGADSKPRLDVPDPNAAPVVNTPTVLRVDDDPDFWKARDVLTHTRDFARARMVSPWAMLGITLAHAAAQVPPFVVLPAIIGGHASINLFVGVVGASGDGKGGSEAATTDAFTWPERVETHTVGSGEAISHAYMGRKQNPETKAWEIHQHTTRALFSVAEIDTFAALNNRTGATLMPELRKAWMGERLGFHYVDPQKRLPVPSHAYRLCLIAGIQPARAHALLDDTAGGTPQRFIWLPAGDPDVPDIEPSEPPKWQWAMPRWGWSTASGHVVLDVCARARDTIKQARRDRLRGSAEALDGHALLARLKVAAALGILDQRAGVTDEDWELAGTIMGVSDAVRNAVVAELAAVNRQANVSKGKAEAERAVMVDEGRSEAAVKRVIRAMDRRLTNEWQTEGELRRSVTSNDRGYVPVALQRLIDNGLVECEDGARTERYRRRSK